MLKLIEVKNMKVFTITISPFMTNCYLVYNNKLQCFIIDPSNDANKIVSFITEHSLTPEAILLTHGHFDHIGACDKLCEHYGISIYIHENDAVMLKNPSINGSELLINRSLVINKLPKFFKDGDEIMLGDEKLRIMHTPGHTQGSCVLVSNEAIFSGDTVFKNSYGRYDLYGGSFKALADSIRKILSLNPDLLIYPGHGELTSVQNELKNY